MSELNLINIEVYLLKFLLQTEYYKDYRDYVILDTLEYKIQMLIKVLDKYYRCGTTSDGDQTDAFLLWLSQTSFHEVLKEEQKIFFDLFFNKLQQVELKPEYKTKLLTHYQAQALKAKLLTQLETEFTVDDLKSTVDTAHPYTDDFSTWIVPNDMQTVYKTTMRSKGLKFRLGCLNKALGGLIKGDFVVVAAYIGTGKSAFVVSESTYMAQQLTEGRVLYLNNEEEDNRILKKIYSATLGIPASDISMDIPLYEKEYRNAMHGDPDRIVLAKIGDRSLAEIKQFVEFIKPKLLIIDQIDHIRLPGSFDSVPNYLRLAKLYYEIHELAKQYCPIIGVCQTDASVRSRDEDNEGMRYQHYIDQSQLDGSKIGKQASADAIITIGKDLGRPNIRYIHVPKNRMDGIDSEYRSIKAPVVFNGDLTRYEDE